MATLTTLRPGASDTTGLPTTGSLIGTPGGATALSDDSDSTQDAQSTNATGTYQHGRGLANVDADFGTILTLTCQFRYGWASAVSNSTWDTLDARVVKSDGSSVLAAATSGGAFKTIATPGTTATPTNSSAVAFDYVDTAATKADWDGALIQIQWTRTRSKGGDAVNANVYEAWINGTYTPSFPFFKVDALIAIEQTSSFSADAVIKSTQASGTTLDAVIYIPTTTVVSEGAFDGSVFENDDFQVGGITLDAVIDLAPAGFTADSVILATQSASFTADAAIEAPQAGSATVDAVLRRNQSGSFSADAVKLESRPGSLTLDAALKRTQTASLTVDSAVLATQTGSFSADAAKRQVQSSSFTADALLLASQAGSFTADSVILATQSASLSADAVIVSTQVGSFPADAVILASQSASFTSDAAFLFVATGSFTADALALGSVSAAFTADAVILASQSGSFGADAVLLVTQGTSFVADALVEKEIASSFLIDAERSLVGKCTWTTPGDTVAMSSTATLAFYMPTSSAGDMHFQIEIDQDSGFGGPTVYQSPGTGWEFWDGDSWEPIPSSGVSVAYLGNEARYTIQTPLSAGTWYRRVRAGVVGT